MPEVGKKEAFKGKPKVQKFRLLASLHEQADREWEPTEEEKEQAKTLGRIIRPPRVCYKAGDIVESEIDLVQKFGGEKFAYLGQPPVEGQQLTDQQEAYQKQEEARRAPAPPTKDAKHEVDSEGFLETDLHAMSVQDLKAFAADHEVDLKGARNKEDMIKTIRASKS